MLVFVQWLYKESLFTFISLRICLNKNRNIKKKLKMFKQNWNLLNWNPLLLVDKLNNPNLKNVYYFFYSIFATSFLFYFQPLLSNPLTVILSITISQMPSTKLYLIICLSLVASSKQIYQCQSFSIVVDLKLLKWLLVCFKSSFNFSHFFNS